MGAIVDLLQSFGDHRGLQHEERWMSKTFRWQWRKKPRYVFEDGELHGSVYDRFNAGPVPIVDEIKPYRPEQLRQHNRLMAYFNRVEIGPHRPEDI